MLVVVALETGELSLQVTGVPEEYVIKKLTANGPNQSFHERMRSWNVRNAFDLIDLQNP